MNKNPNGDEVYALPNCMEKSDLEEIAAICERSTGTKMDAASRELLFKFRELKISIMNLLRQAGFQELHAIIDWRLEAEKQEVKQQEDLEERLQPVFDQHPDLDLREAVDASGIQLSEEDKETWSGMIRNMKRVKELEVRFGQILDQHPDWDLRRLIEKSNVEFSCFDRSILSGMLERRKSGAHHPAPPRRSWRPNDRKYDEILEKNGVTEDQLDEFIGRFFDPNDDSPTARKARYARAQASEDWPKFEECIRYRGLVAAVAVWARTFRSEALRAALDRRGGNRVFKFLHGIYEVEESGQMTHTDKLNRPEFHLVVAAQQRDPDADPKAITKLRLLSAHLAPVWDQHREWPFLQVLEAAFPADVSAAAKLGN